MVPPLGWDTRDLLGSQRTVQEPSLGVLRPDKTAPRASDGAVQSSRESTSHPFSLRVPFPFSLVSEGPTPAPSPEDQTP